METARGCVLACCHLHVNRANRLAGLELITPCPCLVFVHGREVPQNGLELTVLLEPVAAPGLLEALELAKRIGGLLDLREVDE